VTICNGAVYQICGGGSTTPHSSAYKYVSPAVGDVAFESSIRDIRNRQPHWINRPFIPQHDQHNKMKRRVTVECDVTRLFPSGCTNSQAPRSFLPTQSYPRPKSLRTKDPSNNVQKKSSEECGVVSLPVLDATRTSGRANAAAKYKLHDRRTGNPKLGSDQRRRQL
jgi:hypothetical protein